MLRFVTLVIGLLWSSAASSQVQAPQRIAMPALQGTSPERLRALLGVSSRGLVAFTHAFDERGRLVTLVDSTGRELARFSRAGDGPGEFRFILGLFVTDTTVYVLQAARLAAFDLRGRHLWTRALNPGALVLGIHGDSADMLVSPDPLRHVGLQRVSLTSMRGRTIIPDRGEPLHSLSRSRTDSTRTSFPSYARLPAGIALGDGIRYRIVRVSDGGAVSAELTRRVPEQQLTGAALDAEIARRLAAARRPFRGPDGKLVRIPVNEAQIRRQAAAPRAFFNGQTGGMQVDATGRIYTVIPLGDSTALDFFQADRFVGRVHVPCAGRRVTSRGSGRMLALLCETSAESDFEAELQLYRIP